jgi:hypothetical protein
VPTLGPESAFIFRITHVDNVAWILRHGLHSARSRILDPDFVEIGSHELIEKQKDHEVPIPPGGVFSDYVRFYFTPWSIMLYNVKTGYHGITQRDNREVAILVSSLHKVSKMGLKFVFTDQHAYGKESTAFNDLNHLDEIDWDLLRAKDFRNDPEDPGKKGRYQAEALVHRKVPVEAILGITCYDASVQARLTSAAQQAGVRTPIKVLPNWYF